MAKKKRPARLPAEMMAPVAGAMPRLSKFQAYTFKRVARRDLKNAPYNPRTISKYARKKLTEIIRRGLVEAVVWNERTGNIVGGHQRTDILDALERTQNYSLDICAINVTEKRERELNIALNHPGAQGEFDPEKLAETISIPDFDASAAGLDMMELEALLGDQAGAFAKMFSVDAQPDEVKRDIAELGEISKKPRAGAKKRQADETPDERVERMKGEKKEYREQATERDDTEFYLTVVFKDRAHREAFLQRVGKGPNERYLDARVLEAEIANS